MGILKLRVEFETESADENSLMRNLVHLRVLEYDKSLFDFWLRDQRLSTEGIFSASSLYQEFLEDQDDIEDILLSDDADLVDNWEIRSVELLP